MAIIGSNFIRSTRRGIIYTPPTEFGSSKIALQISGNGAHNANNFRDVFGNAIAIGGSPIYSTNQSKWNNSAIYFDGSSNLQFPLSTPLTFAANSFTWEAWVYVDSATFSTGYQAIFGNARGGGAGNAGLFLALRNAGNGVYKFSFRHWLNGSTNAESSQNINLNTWYHVACTKSGTTLNIYVNGIKGTLGSTNSTNTDYDFNLGQVPNQGGYAANFRGFLDDIRLTNDGVRYSNTFDINLVSQEFSWPVDTYQDSNVLLIDFELVNGTQFVYDHCGAIITGTVTLSTAFRRFNSYSGFFNGTSDALVITPTNSNAFNFGTGDFTIEGWFYLLSNTGSPVLLKTGVGGTSTGFALNSQSKLEWWTDGVGAVVVGNTTITTNTWHHLAVSRENGVYRLFVNGVLDGTSSQTSHNINLPSLALGKTTFNGYYSGYIDSIRVNKSAIRTATFTPENYPFILERDPLIHRVSLGLKFNGVNNNTNFVELTNRPVTPVGNAVITNVRSKYNGTSALIDGNNGYLELSNATSINFSSADNFTLEAWVFKTQSGSVQAIISNINGSANRGYSLLINSDERLRFEVDGANPNIISSLVVPINQWCHVSLSKVGNNYTFSVDGLTETITNTTSWLSSTSSIIRIGRTCRSDFPYVFASNVDEVRITREGRYSSPFNVDNGDTLLFMPMRGVNGTKLIAELTCKNFTVNGATQVSTSLAKFYGSSISFVAGGANTIVVSDTSLVLNSDFTVEAWVYVKSVPSIVQFFALGTSENTGRTQIGLDNTGRLWIETFGIGAIIQDPNPIPLNQWHHVTFTRQGSTIRIFLNGNIVATASNSSTFGQANGIVIGGNLITGCTFDGNMNDVILTRRCKYTANFTPSNSPAIFLNKPFSYIN